MRHLNATVFNRWSSARRTLLGTALACPLAPIVRAETRVSRLLYVVCPGIRDYLELSTGNRSSTSIVIRTTSVHDPDRR
jgi:hypothetical protein